MSTSLFRTCATLTLCIATTAATATQFSITDLSALGMYAAWSVNDSGHVVGSQRDSQTYVRSAVLYDGTDLINLGSLSGAGSEAFSINNPGQVVGTSYTGSERHAFVANASGANASYALTDLGTLGGTGSYAYGINDSGLIAGYSTVSCQQATCDTHAFVGDASGLTDIGGFGGNTTRALAINNSGQATGQSNHTGNTAASAFIWSSAGGMLDLGTLGGLRSHGWDINDSGVVAGWSQTTSGSNTEHAFIGSAPGLLQDLGTLGGTHSRALGINNNGEVVGNAQIAGDTYHAFLWDATDGLQDLNSLVADLTGWSYLDTAAGISNTGHIVGTAYDASGERKQVLLTPIVVDNTDPAPLGTFGPGALGSGWLVGQNQGTAEVVQSPVDGEDDQVVKLTTGSPVSIVQDIDTPSGPFSLSFDFLFGTTTGELKVFLNAILLGTIDAPGTLLGTFTNFSIEVTDQNLFALINVPIEFLFDGTSNSIVYLDDVSLLRDGADQVPEPSTVILLVAGLSGVRLAHRRGKERRTPR